MTHIARLLGVLACSASLLGSSAAHAKVLWRGDVSTGNVSQWSSVESVAPQLRLQVVTSPVPAGLAHSLRTEVQQGDVICNGNRNELDYETDRPNEGDERYYHWKTMWPSGYVSPDYWQLFTQWHQYVSGGSPPLAMIVQGEKIQMGSNTRYFWNAPLVRGVWHDFIVHVVWSSDASVGAVELWYDGQHALASTHAATLFANDTIYLKQGLYRKNLITADQMLFHAGMTVATALSDVLPPGAPDAGTIDGGAIDPDAGTIQPGPGASGPGAPGPGTPGPEAPDDDPPTSPGDAGGMSGAPSTEEVGSCSAGKSNRTTPTSAAAGLLAAALLLRRRAPCTRGKLATTRSR